ncbi:hypothetical protein [Mesorhizobium huakuii]|uniref:Helix-turn-helix domain-containing protein n=1 Tax=Mesorhizobium huakuii TaxID=28104 RepID=A0ABZ0VQH8_9HYPH|nr:hypothetical protein [Mesorhizobium huakuii]WQB99737.1 hypothetical protein U0R22_003930 [Mesorhizobium huakuii]
MSLRAAYPRSQSADAFTDADNTNNPPDIDTTEPEQQPDQKEWRMHGHYRPENWPLSRTISQQGIMRQYIRVWRHYIPVGTRDTILIIIDKTVNWGASTCRLTYRQIEQASGPRETQARAHIKWLVAEGLITVEHFRGAAKGMRITLNLDWEPSCLRVTFAENRGGVAKCTPTENRGGRQVTPTENRGTTPTENRGGTPTENRGTFRENASEGTAEGNSKLRGNDYSSPAGTEGSAPKSETFHPIRQRARPVVHGASGEKTPPAKENPPVPAAPLSDPNQATSDQTIVRVTPQAIEETLHRSAEQHWPKVAAWPDDQRRAVAQCIATNWRGEPDQAHRFAEWVVGTWSNIELTYAGPEYPEAVFINRHSVLLLSDFRGSPR